MRTVGYRPKRRVRRMWELVTSTTRAGHSRAFMVGLPGFSRQPFNM